MSVLEVTCGNRVLETRCCSFRGRLCAEKQSLCRSHLPDVVIRAVALPLCSENEVQMFNQRSAISDTALHIWVTQVRPPGWTQNTKCEKNLLKHDRNIWLEDGHGLEGRGCLSLLNSVFALKIP